jgi:uncharacterized LabA/DUF88 family protein
MRVNLYIDYWNFQSTIWDQLPKRARIAWKDLCAETIRVAKEFNADWRTMTPGTTYVFASRPPEGASLSEHDRKNLEFLTMLNTYPDIVVSVAHRKWRDGSVRCNTPECHHVIDTCPICRKALTRSEEKGVDAALFTKIVGDVVDGHTDAVIIASQDTDMVPIAEFLEDRGIPVINLGFQEGGNTLAETCSALVTLQEILPRVHYTA